MTTRYIKSGCAKILHEVLRLFSILDIILSGMLERIKVELNNKWVPCIIGEVLGEDNLFVYLHQLHHPFSYRKYPRNS